MSDINSVTEGRVTVTANDTEENIRAAAGFPDAAEPDAPASKPTETETAKLAREREADWKFKAKEADAEPAKPAEADKKSGNPRTSYQAKIDLAIRNQREAERQRDELKQRLDEREAEYQARSQPAVPAQPSQPAVTNTSRYLADVQRYQAEADAPKFQDFVDAGLDDPYTVHQAAMAAYIADRRLSERDAMSMYIADRRQTEYRETEARQAQERERHSHLQDSFSMAAERHPEIQDLLSSPSQQAYPKAVVDHLMAEAAYDPSLSAELFHHLLTHPDDAARLAMITTPIAAAREVGRLTAGLSSAPPGPETDLPRTMAKPLIKPVRPSVMAHESSPPDDLPFGPKYIAAMNEREDRKSVV